MNTPAGRRAALASLVEAQGVSLAAPPLLLPADPFFDLAGEEFGRRMLLTVAADGTEYCLRPDFTLPIVSRHLENGDERSPAGFGYLGPIFRQRDTGPAEFEQAGIELLGQPDPDAALDRVFGFALGALEIFGVRAPRVRLGGVGLFEALLAQADMPAAWRPRIRHRFGHPEALAHLIQRLKTPAQASGGVTAGREALEEAIATEMLAAGFGLTGSRTPAEIAERAVEQQALEAARVPAPTVALLQAHLAISAPAREALGTVARLAAEHGLDLAAPLAQLALHAGGLERAGAEVVFDAGFSPRLDYYTGIVFEVTGRGGEVLASGGQYDRLLERLGARSRVTAAGCAVWVDRLEAEASP